jgi:hypothetical protein
MPKLDTTAYAGRRSLGAYDPAEHAAAQLASLTDAEVARRDEFAKDPTKRFDSAPNPQTPDTDDEDATEDGALDSAPNSQTPDTDDEDATEDGTPDAPHTWPDNTPI